ncbi:hypothetical protein [Thioclava sp.]|uniref:hypothetical protein n=1 Tax=Thioclava sp. TaxID=1933450 RepID=UPI003AA9A829
MTGNIVEGWGEIVWVIASIVVLAAFALALALPQSGRRKPASHGHRLKADETGHEEIGPDGYIDTFSNEIEEAGGSVPPVVKLAIPVVLLWWLGYILLNWTTGSGG